MCKTTSSAAAAAAVFDKSSRSKSIAQAGKKESSLCARVKLCLMRLLTLTAAASLCARKFCGRKNRFCNQMTAVATAQAQHKRIQSPRAHHLHLDEWLHQESMTLTLLRTPARRPVCVCVRARL